MGTIPKIASQIRPYMKENGYTFSKKCYYKIQNDMAFCIQFDMPSGLVYATFFVMPLYIPCQNRYYTYGNRINALSSQLSVLTSSASDNEIAKWCVSLCDQLEKIVFPFFQKVSTPLQLVNAIDRKWYSANPLFSCPAIHVARLKLFSYLYTEEFESLLVTIKKYPQVLKESSFLAKSVCDLYCEELALVNRLIQASSQERCGFFRKTIEETLHKCFQ